MPQVLILGADGQLGAELQRCWPEALAFGRLQCDLTDPMALRRCLRDLRPGLILNAAAFTAVEQAEHDEDLAMRVNARAPGVLAEEAARLEIPLVHYSTDYVFSGRERGALTEETSPAPLNAYGCSKLAGEQAIQRSGAHHLILRTSWVYSGRGDNFVSTILRLANTREALRIVNDQVGSPTWARDLAEATVSACARAQTIGWEEVSGLYHLSADGETTWYGFACEILSLATRHGRIQGETPEVVPVSSTNYGAKAVRPARSVLCNRKFNARFGIHMPHWRTALERFFAGHGIDAKSAGQAP